MNIAGFELGRPLAMVLPTALGIYLVLAAALYFFQPRLVYFPERQVSATPAVLGLEYREVSFTTADDILLAGWMVEAPGATATVLFCHGNAGNIAYLLEVIAVFHRLGLNILVFDYRGYGDSAGSPSEQGTYLDARAAWDFLVDEEGIQPERVILCGRSLGGPIAAHLARQRPPAALILEATFTSLPELAQKLYPIFPVRLLARFQYDTRAYLAEVDAPVLVVHSRDDELIPFAHGRRLFEAAGEPKALLEIQGGHNDGFTLSAQRYREGIQRFIAEHIDLNAQRGVDIP